MWWTRHPEKNGFDPPRPPDYSVVKTQALAEPLVDTVDAAQICCSSAAVKTIDLLTCRKEDAQLDTPFSLKVIRNDVRSSTAFVSFLSH